MGRARILAILVTGVLAGCQSSPRAPSPAVAAQPGAAPRDTIPFDESEIVKPALHYGSFHVAADSARSIVARSLGAWGDSAVWRKRDMIEFDYRDSIQVMAGVHPMWVLGSRPVPPVPGWTMTLLTHSNALEGERTLMGGLRSAGWVEDGQYSTDGADGSTVALVSEEAICRYSATWDGGDESDSSYAPQPGMSIELQCVPRFPVRRGPLVRSR